MNELPWKWLHFRVGRQFPDMPYSSANLIDGIWTKWTYGEWEFIGSVGQAVDVWSGSSAGYRLQYGANVSMSSSLLQWSAGYLARQYDDMQSRELCAGFNAAFDKNVSMVSSLAYEMGTKLAGLHSRVSRAQMSISWHAGHGSLSVTGSHWCNPFDQVVVERQNEGLPYFGHEVKVPPSDYEDVRLSGCYRWQKWVARGTFGYLSGVRSGWLSQGYLQFPELFKIKYGVGGQVIRSDYIHSYSLNANLSTSYKSMEFKLSTQPRIYQWQPSQSGFEYADNYTEIELRYPVQDRLYIGVQVGAYFRELGDEDTKPLVKATLFYRL
jgi:hypothetical protein